MYVLYIVLVGLHRHSLHSGSNSVRVTVLCGSCLQISVGWELWLSGSGVSWRKDRLN